MTESPAALQHHSSYLREVNEQLIFRLVEAQEHEEAAKEQKLLADLASDVQRSLLPLPCHLPGLNVFSILISRYEVGGDFFDILPSPGNVTFLVGDVIGKGTPAALVMVLALTQFRTLSQTTTSPSALLGAANDRLCQSLRHSSVYNVLTAAALAIDVQGRSASYARAGHEGMLMYRASTKTADLLLPDGVLLGARMNQEYPSITVDIVPGDLLILFTDGLTEARNAEGTFFGVDRLAALVQERTEPDLRAFGDHVISQVRQFEADGAFKDDVILLMIEVTA